MPDSTDSLPPIARPSPVPVDPMDFEATNPLPPMSERDRLMFEAERADRPRGESTIELRVEGPGASPAGSAATVPAIGALPSRAIPPAVEVPPRVYRKRRMMLATFGLTYTFALVGAVVWGVSWPALVGFLVLSYAGMVAHELVLHRLLAHRAFRTSRALRWLMTVFAMAWPARSPIWWAATHRHHHKHTDDEQDVHSPRHGKWRALFGWPFDPRMLSFAYRDVGDLTRLPEMQLLDRVVMLPFVVSLALATLAGWAVGEMLPASGMSAMQGLIWWGLLRALYPIVVMGLVNVFAHQPGVGTRRYETDDASRNVRWLGWLAAGAGWHNNHHHYGHAARAGFFPGEVDPSWWVIGQLEKMGLVWDVRAVPEAVLAGGAGEGEAEADADADAEDRG